MKIGFVSSKGGKSVEPFVDAATRRGVECGIMALEKLELRVIDDGVDLLCEGKRIDYDVLLIRGIGRCLKEFEVLLEYCKTKDMRIVDKGLFGVKLNSGTKSLTAMRVVAGGLPYPKTVFLRRLEGEAELGWPVVIKPLMGKAGEGVEKVSSENELKEKLRERDDMLMVQEWIENDGDYRIIVIGSKALGAVRRYHVRPGEFRNNVSLGAETERVELTDEMRKLAVSAANACGWEFAGIDLIQNKESGKWYVLEVNRAPQFGGFMEATGIDVPDEVISYIEESK